MPGAGNVAVNKTETKMHNYKVYVIMTGFVNYSETRTERAK